MYQKFGGTFELASVLCKVLAVIYGVGGLLAGMSVMFGREGFIAGGIVIVAVLASAFLTYATGVVFDFLAQVCAAIDYLELNADKTNKAVVSTHDLLDSMRRRRVDTGQKSS